MADQQTSETRTHITNPLNVIWIVVDGARNYRTGLDDRDRPEVMDAMRAETINFETAVTSAPSSALAAAAMMTGMDCAYIARHFSEFQFDPARILALPHFLQAHGYQVTTIHDAPQGREMLKSLILPLMYPHYPKGISHGQHWTNEDEVRILEHQFATKRIQPPAFFLLWFDVRRDRNISKTVEKAIRVFKDAGLYDNSIFVMCSDHGYPDPSSGWNERSMGKYSHDMIVTDDNVLVPLLIRYPGSPVKSIRNVVGLVDVFPTILDVLKVEGCEKLTHHMCGQSLVPLIEGRPGWTGRVIRIDTRLALASGRITALRSDSLKYVYYHDSRNEALYDLASDATEIHDIAEQADRKENLQAFRRCFRESQDAIDAFHLEELAGNYETNIEKLWPSSRRLNVESVLIATQAPALFLTHLVRCLRETFPNAAIDHLLNGGSDGPEEIEAVGFDHLLSCDGLNQASILKGFSEGRFRQYDLVLLTTENSGGALDVLDMKGLRRFKKKRMVLVDYNMRVYPRFLMKWIWPFRRFFDQWDFYRHEPRLMLGDVFKTVRSGIASRVLGRKRVTLDAEWAKQRRDRDLRSTGSEACRHEPEE